MRQFLRMLRFDLMNGFWQTRKTLLMLLCLFILFVLAFYLRIGEMSAADGATLAQTVDTYGPFSMGDLLAFFSGGMRKWVIADDGPFPFPAAWMAAVGISLYLTLWYPYRDLRGFGTQILVRGKSRWIWWLSKCAWAAIWSCAPCLVALGVSYIWALLSGDACDFSCADSLRWVLGQERSLQPEVAASIVPFLASVPFILVSLGLLQLTLSLLMRPTLSFASCFSLLFVSGFFTSAYLPGNYLMSLRTSALMAGGMDPITGMGVAMVFSVACVLAGGLIFSRTSIVDKEFDS